MQFTKMHGIGNDYIFVDARSRSIDDPPALARLMSDRHFGIGSDGLILILPPRESEADWRMQMFNADGSEAQMCGNGLRCFAKWLYDRGQTAGDTVRVATGAGVLTVKVAARGGVAVAATVNMGRPRLLRDDIPMKGEKGRAVDVPIRAGGRTFRATCLSMGNPHCVIYVDDLGSLDLSRWGPLVERHELFPRRVNVEFVQRLNRSEVIQHTWERGSGETLGCGTGASAVCVAGVLNGLTERAVTVHLKGGDLTVEWREDDGCVYKTGPAVEVFSGEWPL